ncbi:S-layer homology domain-containing protein [Tumebacillus sp. ITR2]|uniref:S-layer homology domain-containing protein n=1 Tax=Tumebacillus amylolyticus TaxID=2801339 RepID=A0ABS1JGB1_9BACL|nr:DUF6612 family protein [Tumebacillus amylolyticus]MBL0389318.1 S-layer homology domain-containing protein [Tumebacillus amylolyticus]
MKRKLPSLLLTGVLLSSVLPISSANAQTPALNDLGSSYAQTEIRALIDAGIIAGYEDNTFRPAATMTRQEFATLLSKALNLTPNPTASAKFTDVESWAQPFVGALVTAGLTSGTSATTFGANDPITREQLAAFFVRAMGKGEQANSYNLTSTFADENATSDYAKPLVALTQHIGFIKGSQDAKGTWTFDPQGNAERQAVARLAYEFHTHGNTYTTKTDSIGSIIDLLDRSDAAMAKLSSYHTVEKLSGPDFTMDATIDFTRDPLTAHEVGTITGKDNSGTPINEPVEFYIADGTEFMKSPDGTWGKAAFSGTLEDLLPTQDNRAKNSHFLAPFLTETETADTYTLSGTVPAAVIRKLLVDPDTGQLPAGLGTVGDAVYSFNIAKDTLYQKSLHNETTIGTDKSVFDLTLSNYNAVPPVTVPDDIKTTAQDMSQ